VGRGNNINNNNNNNYRRDDGRAGRAGTRRKQDGQQNTWPRGRVPEPTELRDENMCRRRRRCRSVGRELFDDASPLSAPAAHDRRLSRSPATAAAVSTAPLPFADQDDNIVFSKEKKLSKL